METGTLVGLDLVELNPDIGTHEDVRSSTEVACIIAASALGSTII